MTGQPIAAALAHPLMTGPSRPFESRLSAEPEAQTEEIRRMHHREK
jgi:hypothetical protein